MTERPTHADGIAASNAIATEFGIDPNELRWFASEHLAETHPGLDEIGSSDVSIHLAFLGNYESELLRAEAARLKERDTLVKRVAAHTGRTEAETLAALRELFAPIQD